ncbi:MAG: hypothetical protein AAF772_20135 [Acidobacteriota bacterium]
MDWRRHLLWIDCSAGAAAGVTMLALSDWLSRWYQLPKGFMLMLGAVNLLYAAFSFSLARRARRPPPLLRVLIIGNGLWGVLCLAWAAMFARTASVFGLAHLTGEGLLVGGLAVIEWRWRHLLENA